MEQKHSGLGIASFVLGIVVGVLVFLMVVVAGAMQASTPGGIDEQSPVAVVLGLFILGLLALDMVALGLGIGSLFQSDRKKIFGVLGTLFSALTIAGTVLLIIIGSMMQ